MLISELVSVLRRWWFILLPALIVAGPVALILPPTYQSSAQVLLVPSSQTPGSEVRVNPYLNFNQTLFIAADVVRLSVTDQESVQRLRSADVPGTFSVELDKASSGPVLLVTGTGTTPREARRIVTEVVDSVKLALKDRQLEADAPADSLISTVPLTEPTRPIKIRKAQIQLAIVVLAGSALVGIFLVALLERRRRRREATPSDWGRSRFARQSRGRGRPDDRTHADSGASIW